MGTIATSQRGSPLRAGWIASCLWVMLASAASAQQAAQAAPSSDLLIGAEVNEASLVEALSPDGVRKRSLRVKATASPPGPARLVRPSASLLITFLTGSSTLTSTARQQLDVVGTALKNSRLASYRFTVEGHADPRGSSEANLVLSRQRADSVRSYLVDTHGIDPARLMAEGKGESELLNTAYPAAPENRRVTIATQVP